MNASTAVATSHETDPQLGHRAEDGETNPVVAKELFRVIIQRPAT